MRAHVPLLGMLLVVGGIITLVNVGLFAFLQSDNIGFVAKNGLTGVNIEREFRDIPVYPQATLVGSSAKQLRFSYIYQNILDSTDSVPQVSAWYVDALRVRGWVLEIAPADTKALAQYLTFEKKWNRQLVLSLSSSGERGRTIVTIDLGPKYHDDDLLVN